MGIEIERKFLVTDESWRQAVSHSRPMRQGYLASSEQVSIRVRSDGERAYLNLKSATLGVTRSEYEYPLPLDEAEEILQQLCDRPLIEKRRHYVEHAGATWEVDEFAGDNAGLIVAEIELDSADQPFERPSWLGREVSDDPRYYNVLLVRNPYNTWSSERD